LLDSSFYGWLVAIAASWHRRFVRRRQGWKEYQLRTQNAEP
jgi:hypothetical protein